MSRQGEAGISRRRSGICPRAVSASAPLPLLLLRFSPLSSLIADQLIAYAQTAPFLVQYCSYRVAQRCLARCEGGQCVLWCSLGSSQLISLLLDCQEGAGRGLFASLLSPLPQPLSFLFMLKCSFVKK